MIVPQAVAVAAVAFGLGVAVAAGAGAWWTVGAADRRTVQVTEERDEARRDLAAQLASLRVLTEAGIAAREAGGKALVEAQSRSARDRTIIERLRAEIAAGGDLTCTDAVAQVQTELLP